ncbi:hypothetical protein [Georgenia faecalis]|uniref:DUF4190 domain-containing protein n=1 Tax=Georgenia faecalis TaxID=2483799 RepID=A0ABV9DC23_9MICO|nr:hypothetical protein [Georgenia faecalis]
MRDRRASRPSRDRSYGSEQARAGQEAGMAAHYGDGSATSPTEKNRLGTAALVAGIVAMFALIFPVVIALPLGILGTAGAVVLGVMALRAIAAGRANNRAAAIIALVLGVVGVLMYALAVIGLVALGASGG